MTLKQQTQANAFLTELRDIKPTVKWVATWNYHSKLPEFTAIKDGGVHFTMFTRDRMKEVTQDNGIKYRTYTGEKYTTLEATTDMTTHDNGNGMIVSGAHNWNELPRPNIKQEIARKDFKKYLEFVRANLGILENIGA